MRFAVDESVNNFNALDYYYISLHYDKNTKIQQNSSHCVYVCSVYILCVCDAIENCCTIKINLKHVISCNNGTRHTLCPLLCLIWSLHDFFATVAAADDNNNNINDGDDDNGNHQTQQKPVYNFNEQSH